MTALSSVGRQGSGLAAGGAHRRTGRGPSGGVSAKRRRKQFGFRRNPLRTADSWKTFAWIRLSPALLRCSRALAERPAAWTVFRGRQWARAVRNAAAASPSIRGDFGGRSGFDGWFPYISSRQFPSLPRTCAAAEWADRGLRDRFLSVRVSASVEPRVGLDLDLHFRPEKPGDHDDRRRRADVAENLALHLQHRLAIGSVGDEGPQPHDVGERPARLFRTAAKVA